MAKLSEKIGYGLGDMSSSMFWKIFTYYLPFFYTNVFGLTLGDAAMLLLITKLWDAVYDTFIGVAADRTETRWGKYRPYILWVAIPFAVVGVLTFTAPDFDAYTTKLVYAYVTYILMMMVYSTLNVPYGAMLGVLSADPQEKTVFSSFRMFFAYGGSFLSIAIFEPLCRAFGGSVSDAANVAKDVQAGAWQNTMIVISSICAILFFLCFFMTKENVKPIKEEKSEGSSIGNDIKSLLKNVGWWVLLGAGLASVFFNSIRGGAAAYFFKDYLGIYDTTLIAAASLMLSCAVFLSVGEISNMIGVVLAVPVSARFGKKWTYVGAMIITTLLSVAFYYIPTTTGGFWTMLILQIAISACAGITFPLLWSMFADVADWSEYTNGHSSTGLIFSSNSMAQKFGGAFGSALVLWLLAAFDYKTPDALEQAGIAVEGFVQSDTAKTGLNLLMSWIPAATSLIAAAVAFFYPLSDDRVAEIAKELEGRRAESQDNIKEA